MTKAKIDYYGKIPFLLYRNIVRSQMTCGH